MLTLTSLWWRAYAQNIKLCFIYWQYINSLYLDLCHRLSGYEAIKALAKRIWIQNFKCKGSESTECACIGAIQFEPSNRAICDIANNTDNWPGWRVCKMHNWDRILVYIKATFGSNYSKEIPVSWCKHASQYSMCDRTHPHTHTTINALTILLLNNK